MKKLFIATLLVAAIGTSAFAFDANKVSYKVLHAFEIQFTGASAVQWTVKPNFTKVSFVLEDQKVEAFYNADGEEIGFSRATDFGKLPLNAIQKIRKNYADYKVTETIEFDRNGDRSYYVSLANGNAKQILEVSFSGSVSVFQPGK